MKQEGHPNKIDIEIVVNGTPTTVEANVNAPLRTVIGKALEQTNNTGQPRENWDLKDESGNVLDLSKKVEEYNFPAGITLYLSLKAGVGG